MPEELTVIDQSSPKRNLTLHFSVSRRSWYFLSIFIAEPSHSKSTCLFSKSTAAFEFSRVLSTVNGHNFSWSAWASWMLPNLLVISRSITSCAVQSRGSGLLNPALPTTSLDSGICLLQQQFSIRSIRRCEGFTKP